MKTRNGFVSNSSSSSFLIYGIVLSASEVHELLNISEDDDVSYTIKEITGLEVHCPYYNDSYYIGRSFDDIGDDETGRQFKDSVEKKIEESFGKKIECITIAKAWYNG